MGFVTVLTVDNHGEQQQECRLVSVGADVVVVPVGNRVGQMIRERVIDDLDARHGDTFLRELHKHYSGTRLRVTEINPEKSFRFFPEKVFCPTGPGGGVDPHCGSGGSGSSDVPQGELPRELVGRLIKTAADFFHMPTEKISLEDIDRVFEVGGVKFKEAGHYHPDEDVVHIRASGWTNTDHVLRIAAHEIQHHRWTTVMNALQDEQSQMAGYHIHADGRLKDEFKRQFPVYDALYKDWINSNPENLQKDDGVTEYSTAYWKNYNDNWKGKNNSAGIFNLAVNETMSEIAAEHSQTGIINGGKSVRGLYNAVNKAYFKVNKKRKFKASERLETVPSSFQWAVFLDDEFKPCKKEDATLVVKWDGSKRTVGIRK